MIIQSAPLMRIFKINVKSHLLSMTKIVIDWFERNCMQANPEQFQAIFLAPGHKKVQTDFSIDNINIKPEKSIKLLGVELDDKLKFDIQVSSMCKKAAKQLNALRRIGHLLDKSSRLTIFRAYIMSIFNSYGTPAPRKSLQAREDAGTSPTLCLQGLQKQLN